MAKDWGVHVRWKQTSKGKSHLFHLEQVYNHKFSYGTVVQLCVARNHRRSAACYKGVAKVTSHRARKGFQLRYNPDNHWSVALHRNLAYLQYTDGTNIVNINCDDAAGFRLDTFTTHRLHCTPVVRGKEIFTTHTDYVKLFIPSTNKLQLYRHKHYWRIVCWCG